jgi:hypothetical protein
VIRLSLPTGGSRVGRRHMLCRRLAYRASAEALVVGGTAGLYVFDFLPGSVRPLPTVQAWSERQFEPYSGSDNQRATGAVRATGLRGARFQVRTAPINSRTGSQVLHDGSAYARGKPVLCSAPGAAVLGRESELHRGLNSDRQAGSADFRTWDPALWPEKPSTAPTGIHSFSAGTPRRQTGPAP